MSELSVGSWKLLKVVLNDFAPSPAPPPPCLKIFVVAAQGGWC